MIPASLKVSEVAGRVPTYGPSGSKVCVSTGFTHYYFYVRDEVLGPIVVRMASFFPFHATYYLNGHSFMEQELKRKQIGFRKDDNAFLTVDDVAELQAAADRLSPQIIRKQLDYCCLLYTSGLRSARFSALAESHWHLDHTCAN